MRIEWSDNYKTGDDAEDAQHRHLFHLANQLVMAEDIAAIKPLAMQLYQHTRAHFALEEAHMRQANFPELAAHADSHNRLLGRLNVISQGIGQGKVDKSALADLLTDWAMFHIPHDDVRFATFLASQKL